MHTRLVIPLLAATLAVPICSGAHEGHEHVLMGIVQKIDGKTLAVKVRDEKTKAETVVAVALNEKTEVLRGDRPATVNDIKVGERIVIRAVMTRDPKGKDVYTAKRLQVSARPASAPERPVR